MKPYVHEQLHLSTIKLRNIKCGLIVKHLPVKNTYSTSKFN